MIKIKNEDILAEYQDEGYIDFKVNRITYSRFEVGDLIEPIKDAKIAELPKDFNVNKKKD